MKIVLIGFSKQNAQIVETLIKRTYPAHQCVSVERCFDENLRLALPTLDERYDDAEVYLINLDGVGMIGFSSERAQRLLEFIGDKTALLIAKHDIKLWSRSNILLDDFVQFLKSPYNKQEMVDTINSVLMVAASNKRTAKKTPEMSKLEQSSVESSERFVLRTSSHAKFLHRLVDTHFNISQNGALHQLLDVRFHESPLKIVAGSQTVYLDSSRNLALVQNTKRLLEYFAMVKNYQTLNTVARTEPITSEQFDEMTKTSAYTKQTLDTLLWQVYEQLLPDTIDVADHHLLLKIRYMPNFALMDNVPKYMVSLVSSCLVAPKSIAQLQANLDSLGESQESKGVLNKLLLLAILSGVADLAVLEASFLTKTSLTQSAITDKTNECVKKANKTGFLKRLLSKLKINNQTD